MLKNHYRVWYWIVIINDCNFNAPCMSFYLMVVGQGSLVPKWQLPVIAGWCWMFLKIWSYMKNSPIPRILNTPKWSQLSGNDLLKPWCFSGGVFFHQGDGMNRFWPPRVDRSVGINWLNDNHSWVYGVGDDDHYYCDCCYYCYLSILQDGVSKQKWGFNQQTKGIMNS